MLAFVLLALLCAWIFALIVVGLPPSESGPSIGKQKKVYRAPQAVIRKQTPPHVQQSSNASPARIPPVTQQPKTAITPGTIIQLGAFQNEGQAERAWTALSAQFPSVATMGKLIVTFPGGFRLRATAASPGEAQQACKVVETAGQDCFVVR